MSASNPVKRVLLTGATGSVGGRLLGPLEAAGYSLRCLARRPGHLRDRVAPYTEIVEGDAIDLDAMKRALTGIDVAFYLIHALGIGRGWQQLETQAARKQSPR